MDSFSIEVADVTPALKGLSRPECVLCTREAGLFISSRPAGVLHVAPDGTRTRLGGGQEGFVPNGIALRSDGSLLVANMGTAGGVWQIGADAVLRPFLTQVQGCELSAANFVMVDDAQRVWISISTQTRPRSRTYNRQVRDGFVVLVDDRGPRVIAEGFGFTNECRLAPDGSALYVVETFGRRVSRVPLRADGGDAAPPEVFCEFGEGAFPDGCAFDSEGHLWVTSIISNRLYRIDPRGRATIVLEDNDPAVLDGIEQSYRTGQLTLAQLGSNSGEQLLPMSSVAFGGPDLSTVYLGTTHGDVLNSFRSPVAGHALSHWRLRPVR